MKKIIRFTSTSYNKKVYSKTDDKNEPVLIYTALTEDGELYQIAATDRGIPPEKNWIKIKGIPEDDDII